MRRAFRACETLKPENQESSICFIGTDLEGTSFPSSIQMRADPLCFADQSDSKTRDSVKEPYEKHRFAILVVDSNPFRYGSRRMRLRD